MYESEECTQVLFSEQASDPAPCKEKLPVANLDISGEKHIIFNTKNLIGREDLCDIVIKDLSVSSRHAIIDAEDPDAHLIYDLGSTNGTKLGKIKQKPNVRYHIDEGFTVIFGNVTATYHSLCSSVPTATENAEKNCTTIEESPEKFYTIPETPEKTEFSKPDNVELPRKNLQEKIESPKHDLSDLDMFEEDDNSSREGIKQPCKENIIKQNEKNKKESLYDMDTMSLEEDDIFAKIEENSLISQLETFKCKENINTSDCTRAKSEDEDRSQEIVVSKIEKEVCSNLHTNVSNQSNLLNVIGSNSQGEDNADVSIYDVATQEPIMTNENSQKSDTPIVEIGSNLLSKDIKKESSILMEMTYEENQCHEISSSDQRVLKPVIVPDSQPFDDSSQHIIEKDDSYIIPQSQNVDIFGDTVTSDFTELDVPEKWEAEDVFEETTKEITLKNDEASMQSVTAHSIEDKSLTENKEPIDKESPSSPLANIAETLDNTRQEFRQNLKDKVVEVISGNGNENMDENDPPPLPVKSEISVDDLSDSFYDMATQPVVAVSKNNLINMGQHVPKMQGERSCQLSDKSSQKIVDRSEIRCRSATEATDELTDISSKDFTELQETTTDCPDGSVNNLKKSGISEVSVKEEFTDSFFEAATQPFGDIVPNRQKDSFANSCASTTAVFNKEFTDESAIPPVQRSVNSRLEDMRGAEPNKFEVSVNNEFTDSFYEVATQPAQRTVKDPPEDSLSSSKQTEGSVNKEFTDSFYEVATQPAQRTVKDPPEDSLSSSKQTEGSVNKEFTDSFYEVATQPAQRTVKDPPEDSLSSSKQTEGSVNKEFTDSFYEVATQPAQRTVKDPPEDSLSSSKQTEGSVNKEFTDSFYEVATQPVQRTVKDPPEDSLSSSKQTIKGSVNKEFTDSFYEVATQPAQRTVKDPPEDSLISSKQTIEGSVNKEFTDSFYEVATQPAQRTVKDPPEDCLSSSKEIIEGSVNKEFTDSFYEVATQPAQRTVKDPPEDCSKQNEINKVPANKEFTESFYEVATQPVERNNSKTVKEGINPSIPSSEISTNSDNHVQKSIPDLLDVNFFEADTPPAIIKTVSTNPNEKVIVKNVADENEAVPKTILESCDPLESNSNTFNKINMKTISPEFNTEFYNATTEEIPGVASMENLSFVATSIRSIYSQTDSSKSENVSKERELEESKTKNHITSSSSGAISTSLYDAETLNVVSEKMIETQEPLSQILSQQITGTCYDADTLPFIMDNKSIQQDKQTSIESSKKFEELLNGQKTCGEALDGKLTKIKISECKAINLISQEAKSDSVNVDGDRKNVFEEIEKKLNIFGLLNEAHDDMTSNDTEINAVSNAVVTESEGDQCSQFDTEILTPIVLSSKKGVKRVLSDDDSESSPVVCPKRKARPISSEDESQISQQTEEDFEIRFKKKPINVFPESQETCFNESSSKKSWNEVDFDKKESEQADKEASSEKLVKVLPPSQDEISNINSTEDSSNKPNNEKTDTKKESDQPYKGPFEIRFQKTPNNVFPTQDTSLNANSTEEGNSKKPNNESDTVDDLESESTLEPDYFEIRFRDELVYTFPALQPTGYDDIPDESNDDEFPHESFYDEIPDETNFEEHYNEGDSGHPVEENEDSSVRNPTNSVNDNLICEVVEPKEFQEELNPTAIAETSKSSDTENTNRRRSARQKNQHLIDPQPSCSKSLEDSLPISHSTNNEEVNNKESIESPAKDKIKSFKKFKKSTPVKNLKTQTLEMEVTTSPKEEVTNMSEDDTQQNENSYGRGKRRKRKTSFKDFILDGIDMPASQKKLSAEHFENEAKENSGTRKQSRKHSDGVKINVKNSSVQLGGEETVRTSKRNRFSQEIINAVDSSVSLNLNDSINSPSTSIAVSNGKEKNSNISTNKETDNISNNTPSQGVGKIKKESPKSSGLFSSLSLRPSPILNDIWTGPADRVKLSPRVSKINAESSEKSKSTASVDKGAKSSAEKHVHARFKRKASNDNDSPISRKKLFQGSRKEELDSVPSISCGSKIKKENKDVKKNMEGLSENASNEMKIVDKPVETERRVSKRFKKSSRIRESDTEPTAAQSSSPQKNMKFEVTSRNENVQLDSIKRKRKNNETSPVVREANVSDKTQNGMEIPSSNRYTRMTRRKLAESQNINEGEGNTVVLNLNEEGPSTSRRKKAKTEIVKKTLIKEQPSSKEMIVNTEVVKKTLIKGPSTSKETKTNSEVVKKTLIKEGSSASKKKNIMGKAVKKPLIKDDPSTSKEIRTRTEVKKSLNKELPQTPEKNNIITDILKETVVSNSSCVPPKSSTADFTTNRRNRPIRGRKKSKEDILKENEKTVESLLNTLPTVVVTKLDIPSTSKQISSLEPVEKVSKRSKERCISPSKYLNASMSLMSQEFVFDDARKVHPPNSESCKPLLNNIRRSARTKKDEKSEDNEVNILFTGLVDSSLTNRLKQMAGELGGTVVDSPFTCTVVITNKFKRTIKLLSALARGVPIVAPDWLLDSRGFSTFIDTDDYLLECKEDERKYSFVLKESLEKARKIRFLEGWSVFVTKSVKPTPSEMKMIVECSGGKFLTKEPQRWPLKSIVISSELDKSLWGSLKRQKRVPSIVSAEAILSGVLQQHLDVDRFKIV